MKKPIITGRTTDGRPTIYARLFQWKDQEGIPIDISVNDVDSQGFVTDWIYEIEGAIWVGYTQERIIADLSEAYQILYPGQSKRCLKIVKNYFEARKTPNLITLRAIKLTKP